MPSVISSLLEKLKAIADLQKEFENLKQGTFEITSEWSAVYNCIAHAADESHRKWWPVPKKYARNDVFWPDSAPRKETVPAFISAFKTKGYEPCDNGELEQGFEKVVIFVNRKNAPTHMAKQLPDGKWTSKLGSKEDISHDTLHGVEGKEYGRVKQFLRRPIESKETDTNEQTA